MNSFICSSVAAAAAEGNFERMTKAAAAAENFFLSFLFALAKRVIIRYKEF